MMLGPPPGLRALGRPRGLGTVGFAPTRGPASPACRNRGLRQAVGARPACNGGGASSSAAARPLQRARADRGARLVAAAINSTAAEVPLVVSQRLAAESPARVRRLETLVELKKLYRNCLRADTLLGLPTPIYTLLPLAADDVRGNGPGRSRAGTPGPQDSLEEEEERLQAAVELIAEMQLTSEQLRTGLRTLAPGFGREFAGEAPPEDAEARVREVAREFAQQLRDRAAGEIPVLPFESEAQAQVALDVRNSRYNKRLQQVLEDLSSISGGSGGSSSASLNSLSGISGGGGGGGGVGGGSSGGGVGVGGSGSGLGGVAAERFTKAEKVAEKFVANRIKPALQRAQERDLLEAVRESGAYLRGLWDRLNGSGGGGLRDLPAGLPLPLASKKDVERVIADLGRELESLEKRLQEASKARESKLRKAGLAGRVALASQLKAMDAEVITLSRLLAVRTLQLEMEWVYRSLEDEALDIAADELLGKGPLAREGSTGELALLVAEYSLLERQLAALAAALSEADPKGGLAPLTLVDDDLLEGLAAEIPDLRMRVGVSDVQVFGANPFSITKLRLQARDSAGKVAEGVGFLTRGVRLLGSDVGNAGRLFSKAALGGTLKPREVTALRRTARDLLTFIPFIIILIVPITPLGHVLVFGFIQRYFPGFFPSQFTNRRQEIMARYEELQRQLAEAQEAAAEEEEELELARAAAAVARLTAPDAPCAAPGAGSAWASDTDEYAPEAEAAGGGERGGGSGGDGDGPPAGPAAEKLRRLQEQVLEARDEVHAGDDAEGSPPPTMRLH
ncbi:hypothetical protein Rsub_10215 [Raphidocelis subcapitata]|uniref:Letm1 RBD domain-containing protein n=1 Tax=Raphidocelis subcapitata TaxID=307507 RepID=A0A2V0PIR0_9CHLO|nr:hypothetical protein Rsub_10215 [Raphidocelis subcapitata]|eukprot:GBF97790.1 hypothetical protein Rsub_10215 [Raphidocelis subcapitata]